MATADPVYDVAGSIVIGALLVAVALALGAEAEGLLIGENAATSVRRAIHGFLSTRVQIDGVLSRITQQHGDDVAVAVKARMQPMAALRALVDAVNACEAQLCVPFAQARWMFFEPDLAAHATDRSRSC